MNKQTRDAITYAKGALEQAQASEEAGAQATAKIHAENGRIVLRAASLMNRLDISSMAQVRQLLRLLKPFIE